MKKLLAASVNNPLNRLDCVLFSKSKGHLDSVWLGEQLCGFGIHVEDNKQYFNKHANWWVQQDYNKHLSN